MTCEGCSGAVQRVLSKLQGIFSVNFWSAAYKKGHVLGQGIETFEINLQDKKVSVTSSLTAEEVLNVIKKTGKTTELLSSL